MISADIEQLDTQEDGVYTDVREPRTHNQSRNIDLPTYFFNNTEPNRKDTAKNKYQAKSDYRQLTQKRLTRIYTNIATY